ncbi:replication factor-a protein [Neoconidiobolus thromboides FSU 785]|nr:replication factor-a protein [Neoconidiobolus thromboides FSU 785]
MNQQYQLSKGFGKFSASGNGIFEDYPGQVILQVVSIKNNQGANDNDPNKRYKALCWDGESKIQVYFSVELNEKLHSGYIQNYLLIHLVNGQFADFNGKRYIIIREVNALYNPGHILEDPAINNNPNNNAHPQVAGMQNPIQNFQPNLNNNINNPTPKQENNHNNSFNQSFNSNNNQSFNNNSNPNMNQNSNINDSIPEGMRIIPISNLNPFQNKWTIKAVVSFKGDIRQYNNAKGPGRLINIHFMDDSGEIRATAFNEQCDKFGSLLEVNKSYYISNLRIGQANKKYSTLKNDYELTFTSVSEAIKCDEEHQVKVHYEFIPISDIELKDVNSIVDVIGVITDISDIIEFTSAKQNKEFKKREMTLVDSSATSIKFTLWNELATSFNGTIGDIVALHSVKIGEFQGKSLSTVGTSIVNINPEINQAYELKHWYNSNNNNTNFRTLANNNMGGMDMGNCEIKQLDIIKNDNEFGRNNPEKFSCIAWITKIKDGATYPACPSENCNKKVIESSDGWYCAKCNRNFENPDYRFIINCSISDSHEDIWVNLFHDQAVNLLGFSANEFEQRKNETNEPQRIVSHILFKPFMFYIIGKPDTYADQTRVKFTARNIQVIEPSNRMEELKTILNSY